MNTIKSEFSKRLRLPGPTEFKSAFKGAFKLRTTDLGIFAKNNNLAYPRLGINIAKKNIRSAVARNSIKRIIRESFRAHQIDLGQLDIVVVAYKGLVSKDKVEIRHFMDKQWQRLGKQCQKKSRCLG